MCPVTVTEERHTAGRDKPASLWGAAGPRGEPRTPAAEKPRAPSWVGGLPLGLWNRFCLQPSQGQYCSTRDLAGTAQLSTSPGFPYSGAGAPSTAESRLSPQGSVPGKEPNPRQRFASTQAQRPRVFFAPVLGVGAAHRHAPPHSGRAGSSGHEAEDAGTLTRRCLQRQTGRRCPETLLLKTN